MEPARVEQTTTSTAGGGGCDDNSGQKDHTHIVKRKRTKRQRQQSFITHSSTFSNALNSSPATSDDFPAGSTTTEDEDTAKCLILLSKGPNLSPMRINNDEYFSGYKFNSKRYIQTPSSAGDGLAGIYVYECKTCSRTFPSFQALGGHRASHKKPRLNEEKRKPPPYTAFSDEDEPSLHFPSRKNNSSSSSSLSLQLNTKKSSSKLHECSICGTEFNSGQALGGHMRRHRVANAGAGGGTSTNTNTNTTLSLIPYSPVTAMVTDDIVNQKARNDGLCLDLDLNLPAPPESAMVSDQHRDCFKFTANQKKQQPAVHLSSAPTLVDCHY